MDGGAGRQAGSESDEERERGRGKRREQIAMAQRSCNPPVDRRSQSERGERDRARGRARLDLARRTKLEVCTITATRKHR